MLSVFECQASSGRGPAGYRVLLGAEVGDIRYIRFGEVASMDSYN